MKNLLSTPAVRILLTLILVVTTLSASVLPAQAAGTDDDGVIEAGQTIYDDVLLEGEKVRVDGNVEGNVFAGGNTITINGKISGDELKGLAVWTDLNSDARVQAGEVKSLAEHNITELSLNHKQYVSSFVRDGKTERMFDWWPQTFELNRVRLMPRKG